MGFPRGMLLMGFSTMIIPLMDIPRVMLARIREGRNPFTPDKNHIHHKLMSAGLSQYQTLIFILLLAIAYILLNSLLFPLLSPTLLVVIDIALFCIVNIGINYRLKSLNIEH